MIKFALPFSVLLTLIGCHSLNVSNDLPNLLIGIENGAISDTLVMNNDSSNMATASIDYAILKSPGKVKRAMDSITKIEVSSAFEFGATNTIQMGLSKAYFQGAVQAFLREYKEAQEMDDSPGWSAEMSMFIDTTLNILSTLSISTWEYTGGAHGNFYTNYYSIDKATGKELKLNDIFVDQMKVAQIVEPHFRRVAEIPADQTFEDAGLWFDDGVFYVNDNFYITSSSVTFHYNTYEVGPYAAGEFIVEVPIVELEELMIRKL